MPRGVYERTPEMYSSDKYDSRRGRKRTEEQRKKISEAHRGLRQSPEHVAKRIEKIRKRRPSEETRRRMSESARQRVGELSTAYVDGRCSHHSHGRWRNMMDRCYNVDCSSYPNYGGRGISVCQEWHDRWAFFEYLDEVLGPRPEGYTLDRIDNDGNYEPGNIRWASKQEQVRNRRRVV